MSVWSKGVLTTILGSVNDKAKVIELFTLFCIVLFSLPYYLLDLLRIR